MDRRMNMAVTGHRPNKLYGYDLNDEKYQKMKAFMKQTLKERNVTTGISGMALGVDQLFALAVIELKAEGYPIKLHCAIPCKNQEKIWPKASQELYRQILEKADEVHYVSEEEYNPYLMQKRNEYMVNMAEIILAFWNGGPGGTAHCVKYAEKKNKEIILKNPDDFKDKI